MMFNVSPTTLFGSLIYHSVFLCEEVETVEVEEKEEVVEEVEAGADEVEEGDFFSVSMFLPPFP